MEDLHSRMLAAVLRGEGLQGVAGIAATEAGGPVALVLPARGLAAASDPDCDLVDLTRWARDRADGNAHEALPSVLLEVPVRAGDDEIGTVVLLAGGDELSLELDRHEVLRSAALASLAEVAVVEARDELTERLRAGLLEELREHSLHPEDATRRAARLGCDLARGAVAMVADVDGLLPSHASALVRSECDGALAEALDGRVVSIIPARGGDDAPERAIAQAEKLVKRLRRYGAAGHSWFCASPGDLHRAIREAELVLDVTARDERIAEQVGTGLADGVYRLLFRALISEPEEVRSFYEDTVAPLVEHDGEYRTDLVGTLEAYLANDCNMNATARAIYAHRHTISYRLDRVRELTGLDPSVTEERERLGLGIKAYRVLAARLPR
jgi:sugar diacid utilization regulator